MGQPIVHGAAYSVYVRAVRLALDEKGVDYRLDEVDVFAQDGPPPEHLARHPFGKIPAFEHDGFLLYESGAITRYVDEAFPGPALMPSSPKERARTNQAISILDSYVYPTLVWTIFLERVEKPSRGLAADEARLSKAMARVAACLKALDQLSEGPWLASKGLSLADLHAAPMFAYFGLAPEATPMMAEFPRLSKWWDEISLRPSMKRTRPTPQREALRAIR